MFKEILEFCKLVGKLKKVERTGWITHANIHNPESVAEHSFRTAVLAMVISDIKKLNAEKMVRMALLHDLAEAITGDFDRFAKRHFTKEELVEKENDAIDKVLATLPKNLYEKYLKLWSEYRDGKTEEAKMMRQIDKLELLMQALEYEKEGYDKNKLEPFWRTIKSERHIVDKDLKEILYLLEKERKK